MEESELNSKSVQIAAQVIIHAGNARTLVHEALKLTESGDYHAAEAKLETAAEEINSAHDTQTQVIQAEARGEPLQITLLLTHAQDTLMIAMSEANMAKHILALTKKLANK